MSENYSNFVKRLHESVDRLDSCISVAVGELETKGGLPDGTLGRIASYRNIVQKQRGLISQLEVLLDAERWEEVTQMVKSINAMSVMIRDDAQEVLSSVAEGQDSDSANPDFYQA